MLRRPAWKRELEGGVPRISDFDPISPAIQAANRLRDKEQAKLDKAKTVLDRFDQRQRDADERERAAREARLGSRR